MQIPDDGYELFRRAVQERDADAWAAITVRYRRLMIAWATRCQTAPVAGEPCEDLADRALTRAWAALSPERFADFPGLAALLAYLRTCVAATAIDAARARMAHERAIQRAAQTDPPLMEQVVLERISGAELWRIAASLVKTEAERVVLVERFVQDLPPRVILDRHPVLFEDVTAIYAAVRNLCGRLRRNPEIRRLYDKRRVVEAIKPVPLSAAQFGSPSNIGV
jgi:DNA-directed RNA polymerase specialized sigma24 family protein